MAPSASSTRRSISSINVLFPEPQPPKMPTAKRGSLVRTIVASAPAICSNPSVGCSAGPSRTTWPRKGTMASAIVMVRPSLVGPVVRRHRFGTDAADSDGVDETRVQHVFPLGQRRLQIRHPAHRVEERAVGSIAPTDETEQAVLPEHRREVGLAVEV